MNAPAITANPKTPTWDALIQRLKRRYNHAHMIKRGRHRIGSIKSPSCLSQGHTQKPFLQFLILVYGQPSSQVRFASVLAKDGYAVAGIITKKNNLLDGFKVIFMRMDGAKLNSKDSYESEWQGSTFGGEEIALGGDGRPVVGIHGRSGLVLDSLGLVQLDVGP